MAPVERHGVADRVAIVNRRVDVSDYLQRAHAAVLLAKRSDIVKAYPHSLIGALVAQKPVIVTNAIPMADYVRQHQCGIVLDDVCLDSVIAAIDGLKNPIRRFHTQCEADRPGLLLGAIDGEQTP